MLETELDLVLRYVQPAPGEHILDAGCGTGIFTRDFLEYGASVTGLDISGNMLLDAVHNLSGTPFDAVQATMTSLPFENETFDKAVSITALEFIEDAQTALNELFRVTKPGGQVIVATLNSLSPWAERRRKKTEADEMHVLKDAFYRSSSDLLSMIPYPGESETAVHFLKDDNPEKAANTEREEKPKKPDTGAFLAVKWQKPAQQ